MLLGGFFLIHAYNIVKSYGRERVLNHLNLHVAQGEITCVIGPNGSGKSTLLAILAGLLLPDSGEVLFQGQSVPGGRQRSIGFVPQQDSLFPELSVQDNLAFWAAAAGIPLKGALQSPCIKQLDLEGMLRKRVRHLSGGMRRRAAIGASLITSPSVLILDEPFAGLDLFVKNQVMGQLQRLKESGITILYTSHNSDEIVPLSDIVYLLYQGRIAFQTETDALPVDQVALNLYFLNLIGGEPNEP